MKPRWLLGEFLPLMNLPWFDGHILSDPNPDPGLFGPESITWRFGCDPFAILGGRRALALQLAHPLVAAGVKEHSRFREDPMGRLMEIAVFEVKVGFGTTAEARDVVRHINAQHRRVTGTLSSADATPRVPAGSAYRANDPLLVRWVHASMVDAMLAGYEAAVRAVPQSDKDEFVREWNAVSKLMGVQAAFDSQAELDAYISAELRDGAAQPGRGSRQVFAEIKRPPSWDTAPGWRFGNLLGDGLVHPQLRAAYGIPWNQRRQRHFERTTAATRALLARRPQRWRDSWVRKFAMRRVAGEFSQ